MLTYVDLWTYENWIYFSTGANITFCNFDNIQRILPATKWGKSTIGRIHIRLNLTRQLHLSSWTRIFRTVRRAASLYILKGEMHSHRNCYIPKFIITWNSRYLHHFFNTSARLTLKYLSRLRVKEMVRVFASVASKSNVGWCEMTIMLLFTLSHCSPYLEHTLYY